MPLNMTKRTHGGARQNAGRKPKEEKTRIISFRVPESKADKIRDNINKLIKKSLRD